MLIKKLVEFLVVVSIALVPFGSVQAATQVTPGSIRFYADKYGVDRTLAVEIARCESELYPTAKNKGSTAKGLYQFLDGTWKHYAVKKWGTTKGRSVLDYSDSAELGVWVIAKYGTSDWNSSKGCWSKYA